MSQPARDARDAGVLLAVGLTALALLAVLTYRPGGPAWPHLVVNGGTWFLLVVTGSVMLVSGCRLAAARRLRP